MASNRMSKIHKRVAFHKKLHILKNLINSKSENDYAIIMDAFLYISALTMKLKALQGEAMSQNNIVEQQEQQPSMRLNMEKLDNKKIRVNITIEKPMDNYLENILEAFEEKGINVIHARISCNGHFVMESILEINHASNNDYGQEIDEKILSEAILKAIGKCNAN
ncbi:uncharacterized protein LOC141594030 [Silene latifolia]|uniref:uncharacterized protein LOC141594030 n=1 Tax=Silene latifolia TaxID=37657 RepID=UPI003D76DBC4